MKTTKILVSDERDDLTPLLHHLLSSAQVVQVERKSEILTSVQRHTPDLLILDPTAVDVCASVRKRESLFPILVLGTKGHEHVSVQALDLGADDFMHAPFAAGELLARIRALLRRWQMTQQAMAQSAVLTSRDGHIQLDVSLGSVFIGGKHIWLSRTENAFLSQLMRNAECVMTSQSLLERIWGPAFTHELEYVRAYARQLRRKIEPDPSHPKDIQTVSRVGYVFRS
jgi:two-component system, OmpR family, KDP operon response regulator KdpE